VRQAPKPAPTKTQLRAPRRPDEKTKRHNPRKPKPGPTDLNQVPLLLTVPEGAVLLRMDKCRLYELIKDKNYFPSGVISHVGRSIKIFRDPLLAFMAAGGKKLEAVQ
jgi:hypothetical protein